MSIKRDTYINNRYVYYYECLNNYTTAGCFFMYMGVSSFDINCLRQCCFYSINYFKYFKLLHKCANSAIIFLGFSGSTYIDIKTII